MSQLPNSRQKWFCERLGIKTISRDIGSPKVSVTINLDPRASPDVRRLIYMLEYGKDMHREEPFVKDTAEFTKLMNKYAPFFEIYLYRKVKACNDTCIFHQDLWNSKEPIQGWLVSTRCDWDWLVLGARRVYWNEKHFLAKLPHVLDTGLLGRIIHNGCVVQQQWNCGNIKPEKREQAWHMLLNMRHCLLIRFLQHHSSMRTSILIVMKTVELFD